MQTSTEIMSLMGYLGWLLSGKRRCMILYVSSLQIPSPTHVICHSGGHLEFIKTFKELNLLYNKYVIQTPRRDGIHWEITFIIGAGLSQNSLFLPDVIKILNIIIRKHNFSKLYSNYHHNHSGNGFLMFALVGIEVLHMNVAEKVFLSSNHLAFGGHLGDHLEFLKMPKDLSLLYSRYVLQAL